MSLADLSGLGLSDKPSQEILKKFQWAIKRVASEHNGSSASALTQEELIHLIRAWEPKRDIICFYVRWARQLRRNFNLDSIATLLSLSRQCNYTPVNFLRKVKILSIHKNQNSGFGITFHFDIPEHSDIDRDRLNKEFLGLSVTLSLLQEQVTVSSSILGKTGMRQTQPRAAFAMGIPIEGIDAEHTTTVVAHPTTEFHTQPSLLNRIWQSVNHRWLALHITEHLFREKEQPSWSYQAALVFSFQMMAPCGPCRFEYLSPLVGYCLRYPTQASIDINRQQLQSIWKDPSSFMTHGNTCLSQYSNEAKARIIVSCFQELQSEMPITARKISYHRDSTWKRRWVILRAYIIHFWLHSKCNKPINTLVTDSLKAACIGENTRKRKDTSCSNDTSTQPITRKKAQTPAQILQSPSTTSKSTRTKPPSDSTALDSITSSRRQLKNPPTANTAMARNDIAVSTGSRNGILSIHDINWIGLRLITLHEMDCYVRSYLVIHRNDGLDILSELSPLEVYSANNLHTFVHCRLSGDPLFYPKESVGPVVLSIRRDADCFVDVPSKSYHVARERSPSFLESSHLLPTMKDIQVLCEAIVRYGRMSWSIPGEPG